MLLLQVVLIALNAIFACAEIAVISTNPAKLEQLAEKGDKRAKRLLKLTAQPARFLATIQVAITLSGFLGSAFAADNFAEPLVHWLESIGLHIPEAVIVILITLILSFFTLVFGELVPKRLAQRKAESLSLGISGLVYGISKIFAPLVALLTVSTNGILRLFHIDPNATEEDVSEEDIKLTIDTASKQGSIEEEEKELIQNIFEFDDLTAGEIVTHRTELALLWTEESDEEWENTIKTNRFTLYPVCEESVDKVVGILSTKDYFRLESTDRETVMKEAVRPAYFVPDGVKADVLFRNMKQERVSLAVVIDEHGGVLGIVTMNDLIECLLGDLTDEETPIAPEPEIQALEDGSWHVLGCVTLDALSKELGIEIENEDCDTIGGLALAKLGSIPADGTGFTVETEQLSIEVDNVQDLQVVSALVRILPPVLTEEDEKNTDDEENE
ncbi:MAG: HlyC/CorC family transporter [Clostridia bacterium]|nr:HlyC/CorC family transporter [Clostridia bacterium]